MHKPSVTGLVAATFTPFHADGSLHLEQVPLVVEHLVQQNIRGIFVCGSTGEGPSLTIEERKQVAQAYVEAAQGKLFTFVHVGHNSLAEAQALAQHAEQIGADAISAPVPSYFKIQTLDTLINTLSFIAQGAPSLPLYYYHIPALTGVDLDMVAFLEQAGERLPTLAGIKYTAHTLDAFQICMQQEQYNLLFGRDELLLSALAIGTQGFIGSTYNFAAPWYQEIWQAYEANNQATARRIQAQVGQLVRIIHRYGGLPPQKVMMKMMGLDCGPVRLPLVELSDSQQKAMRQELEAIDFFSAPNQPSNPTK